MMCNVKDLRGYAIRATDGVFGTVDDFYFDDQDWGIRYLVVDTGRRRSGRKVLISAGAIGSPDRTKQELPVSLTKTQVKHSPDIDTRRPVSRARNRILRILRVSVLLEWRGPVGHGGVSGQPHDRGQNKRGIKGQPNSRYANIG